MTAIYEERWSSTVAERDRAMKEKYLSRRAIHSSARNWRRSLESSDQQQQQQQPTNTNTTTIPLFSLLCSSRCTARRLLFHHIWTHLTLGAASWHRNGSGPYSTMQISRARHSLEQNLLFAGVGVRDSADDGGVLWEGETWEDGANTADGG
ncbi:unnamed protein product [Zymoseptoria tritici ST99CH_1A5]|uniref:Uncharacterized protein n=1 Tax=Zymoseptoria tritici ST99CH_1A5 TaxID=1276529 RepID=A0A1Y6M1L5_ZYMTR|nr:unnamed protein product [Zymoseptoria tritici ST99CH_1A5]